LTAGFIPAESPPDVMIAMPLAIGCWEEIPWDDLLQALTMPNVGNFPGLCRNWWLLTKGGSYLQVDVD
jgi:hypothetical protein